MSPSAGYDVLLEKSQKKLEEKQSQTLHKMVIKEVDDGSSGTESQDIEEVYTPGALEAEAQQDSMQKKTTPSISRGSARKPSGNSKPNTNVPDPKGEKEAEAWNKVTIVETSDSDEDISDGATTSMRRIDILVEETDSEDEDEQAMLKNNVLDSEKLKEDANQVRT